MRALIPDPDFRLHHWRCKYKSTVEVTRFSAFMRSGLKLRTDD